jgi:two-component system phosphate regulon response regulator OmpR
MKDKKILIVDDDLGICRLLTQYLNQQGFISSYVHTGKQMDAWLSQHSPLIILLDLMLPEEDGLSITRRLRQRSTIPIIMLSAKGLEQDRILGLEVGADDYLPKPFNPRELLARIHALLRRTKQAGQTKIQKFGNYTFNQDTLVLNKKNQEIPLSYADAQLLLLLVNQPNQPISRDFIFSQLSHGGYDPLGRSIDVKIARLRKKIELNPAQPKFIRTIRNQGYRFIPNGDNT